MVEMVGGEGQQQLLWLWLATETEQRADDGRACVGAGARSESLLAFF
jgi:hypothetical protein